MTTGLEWPTGTHTDGPGARLCELNEAEILEHILSAARTGGAGECQRSRGHVDIAAGDDAAVLAHTDGRVVVTTDSMCLGLDWRDDWSTPFDVGVKLAAQNLADIVAMGAQPTSVVCAVAAEGSTRVEWLEQVYAGLGDELQRCGVALVGGDLSGAPAGVVNLTLTALGTLSAGDEAFLRSNARVGEAIVLADDVGRSGAGLTWLLENRGDLGQTHEGVLGSSVADCIRWHRAPRPSYPLAAARRAGIRCALDVSDGLALDAARLASASEVNLDFIAAALEEMAAKVVDVVGPSRALAQVLRSGEEHTLLATCDEAKIPPGWQRVGSVRAGEGVTIDGLPVEAVGWQHFQ